MDDMFNCGICANEHHHEEMCGFDGFTKDDIQQCGVAHLLEQFPKIVQDSLLVCNHCINKHGVNT